MEGAFLPVIRRRRLVTRRHLFEDLKDRYFKRLTMSTKPSHNFNRFTNISGEIIIMPASSNKI